MKRNMTTGNIAALLICGIVAAIAEATFMAMTVYADKGYDDGKLIPMEATAYCYGTTRCDGEPVRTGVCAGKPEWYGKVAAVYEDAGGYPGEFLGYYECLDTGGDERIRNGTVLDIYNPDREWCIRFGRKKVLVELIDGEG